MTIKVFTSNDSGAPVLSGTAGSLINVLDACLINGYNLRILDSLEVTGEVASATAANGHGFAVGQTVLIAGATQAGLNGEWKVSGATATQFTFATPTIADGAVTGTITAKIAPVANWVKPFSGTGKAAYRSTAAGASGLTLRVDDTSATTAAVRGYEEMTDVDSGTGLFPTTAQMTAGACCWRKSSTADGMARQWLMIADGKRFYFFSRFHASYAQHAGYFFGDLASYKAGDGYGCAVISDSASSPSSYPGHYNNFAGLSATLSATQAGRYLARNYNQIGSALPFGFFGEYNVSTVMGVSGMAYPSPVDNGLYVSSVAVNHGGILRGAMPGLYQPLHVRPLSHGDTVSELAGLPGKTLMAILTPDNSTDSMVMIDISGPWD